MIKFSDICKQRENDPTQRGLGIGRFTRFWSRHYAGTLADSPITHGRYRSGCHRVSEKLSLSGVSNWQTKNSILNSFGVACFKFF